MNMKHIIGLMLLFAIVACSNEIENLELNTQIAEEMIIIGDTVSTASISPGNWDDLPDEWFDIYGEPQHGEIKGSYTIVSPIGAGNVTIEYVISYEYSEKLIGPRDPALIEINNVEAIMKRNTPKYLVWQGGALAGPVNFVHSVQSPQRFIDLRIYGSIIGEGGFFSTTETSTNHPVNYFTTYNLNNY